ncbi:MAG: LLM class flavin-dependent oxidoreductase [Rhizobiales bacterium]|nr:LLM class flavin-dependent oxidoreductase [Hyphomicrobiales bacterium]
MPKPIQLMWYLNPHDGPYPWSPDGQYVPDLMRSREIAVQLDRDGYFGTLVVGKNPLIETATWVSVTERLRFLIPIYPGVIPVGFFAQQAQLFDSVSGGRLLINQVNGTDQIVRHYGVNVSSDERYDLSVEYWTQFKKLYAGDTTPFSGKYISYGPPPASKNTIAVPGLHLQDPHTPVWGSGTSPAGIRQAGAVLDTYLCYLHSPDRMKTLIDSVRTVAAEHNRTITAGILCNIIVRETEEEAWAHAQWVLEKTGAQQMVKMIDGRLKTGRFQPHAGSREISSFEALSSPDARQQSNIDVLRAGRVPDARALESYPNVWTGPNPWGAVDLMDQGWGGYFVGSARNVAERIREIQETCGIDSFILAGWPSKEEAKRVSEILMPLLDLHNSRPRLRVAA